MGTSNEQEIIRDNIELARDYDEFCRRKLPPLYANINRFANLRDLFLHVFGILVYCSAYSGDNAFAPVPNNTSHWIPNPTDYK